MNNIREIDFKVAHIEAGLECEDLIEALKKITDDDYNGNNGPEYYTYDENLSDLAAKVNKLYDHKNTYEIIDYVIRDNYQNPYYTDYKFHIEDMIGDDYLVTLAFI